MEPPALGPMVVRRFPVSAPQSLTGHLRNIDHVGVSYWGVFEIVLMTVQANQRSWSASAGAELAPR